MTALITVVFIPQTIFALLSAVGKLAGLVWKPCAKAGTIIGASAGALILCMSLYGLAFGWRCVTVKDVEIPFKDLPAEFDGYRIAHISDLHVGTFSISPSVMSRIVEKVNALSPDVILFTGDIVNLSPDELEPFLDDIAAMKAHDGVYSVLGNHDYLNYVKYDTPDGQELGIRRLIGMERGAGLELSSCCTRRLSHHSALSWASSCQ